MTTDEVDVAIVGGGVAGTYCAWQLAKKCPGKRITLFEMSNRIGGRLLSVPVPELDGLCVELGGMRYGSNHTRLVNTINDLRQAGHGLNTVPFPPPQEQNLAYLRRKLLRRSELWQCHSYNLCDNEHRLLAETKNWRALVDSAARKIWQRVFNDAPPEDPNWEKLRGQQYGPYPLENLPLRRLLQRHMSAEALRFADDASGYNSMLMTWNGVDGLRWNRAAMNLGETFRIEQGFQRLPEAMCKAFQEIRGAQVQRNRRLAEIGRVRGGGAESRFRLRFVSADGAQYSTVHARRLILAMPRLALEQLRYAHPAINLTKHAPLAAVTPIPLFKLALRYPCAWWEKIPGGTPISMGQSVTDLPIRQCYYWPRHSGSEKAVLLIYDDGRDRDYWEGSRPSRWWKNGLAERWPWVRPPGVEVWRDQHRLVAV